MFPQLTDPRAANIAQAMPEGFNRHYRLFRETTREAKPRFEAADWHGQQRAQRERIEFYDLRVSEANERLSREFAAPTLPADAWQQVKLHYIGLLTNHHQPELAETFFNSLTTKLLHRSYFRNDFIFVRPAVSTEHIENEGPAARPTYRACYPTRETLRANFQVQVLSSLFYRNKGAFLVGKVINGFNEIPFALPIVHCASMPGRLTIDAALFGEEDLRLIFSFARAYCMVDMEIPSAYVQFLRSLMPKKPRAEIYNAIGLQKHGKNLFYRDFLHHLRHSSDKFRIAPGIKGMVMLVFDLPSFPCVFTVIKDFYPPPKDATREQIERAVVEYGNAIKDLGAANVFPGDMLWKNFGVTRHAKAVFYDHGEVGYSVGPKDVFPETFAPVLLGNDTVRLVFMAHHADGLDVAFWQAHKERIGAGHVHDVFPCDADKRLRPAANASAA